MSLFQFMSQLSTVFKRHPRSFQNDVDKINLDLQSLDGTPAEFFAPYVIGRAEDVEGFLSNWSSFTNILNDLSGNHLHVDCHGQTRQEQESEGNVWFIVNCRLRNKRGKDPIYLSYVGKRMKWRQNISGAGSGAETWVGLVLAPGS